MLFMDLISTLYPQEKLITLMQTMPNNEQLSIFPWIDDQMIVLDASGNTQGFIIENLAGHNDFALYNEHMNFISSTNEVFDLTVLQDFSGNALSFVSNNGNGGFSEFTLSGEQISAFGNAFGGYDMYNSSFQQIGQSQSVHDHIQWTPSPNIDSFSDYLTNYTMGDLADIQIDHLELLTNDALDFLDLL